MVSDEHPFTVGEQYSPPQYRAGVRWESEHVIVAGTCGRELNGGGGPRFEIGVMVLTNPLKIFCLGGGCGERSGAAPIRVEGHPLAGL